MKNKAFHLTKLGILGGGQLGQMLIRAAIDLNIEIAILDPNPLAPCHNRTHSFFVGNLQSKDDIRAFAKKVDGLTIEIENVNVDILETLEKEGLPVFPRPHIIRMIQDKRLQKQFYIDHGIPTASFINVSGQDDAASKIKTYPIVQKIATGGYDGRGVQVIKTKNNLDKLMDAPGLLEDFVPFEKEISVIVARNINGEVKAYPPVELVFHPEANLVDYLLSPANIDDTVAQQATNIAKVIAKKLEMVGILAVEMFVTKDKTVLVNEMAPRPHNSGHQTIEGNVTSQFEQHLRAIFNLPLGDTSVTQTAVMLNVLGQEGYTGKARYQNLQQLLAMEGVHLHLYGKQNTAPFRKMGHITIIEPDIDHLQKKINWIKQHFKVIT